MENKCFKAVAAVAAFLILSLIAFFIIYSDSDDTCTTTGCVKTSSELLTHLQPSVAPCNDFYAFTCGKFINSEDEGNATDLTDYMKNARRNMIRQMVEEAPESHDTGDLLLTKALNRACMNDSGIEKVGLGVIKRMLSDIGGWPIVERGNWREDRFDWKRSTAELRKFGMDFGRFIKVEIGINKLEPTRHVVNIFPGTTDQPKIRDKDKKTYHEYMVDVAVHFGADKNRAVRDSSQVIEFETQLLKTIAGFTIQNIKHADLYNPRTLSQLQLEIPTIPWVDYINGVLYPSATVTSDEVVNIANPEYINHFLLLLGRTPKRIVANFISWEVIQHYIQYLPKALRDIKDGTELYERTARRDVCLDVVRKQLPYAVEASYVRKYITDEAKRFTKDIIDYIKKEFNKILDDLDWLDGDAKEVARVKLASTKDYIAHTPEAPSRRKLEQIYDEVRNSRGDFLAFVRDLESINLNFKYGKLTEPVMENDDNSDHLIYLLKENKLVLPSYYLQGLFFNEARPRYMNYGAVGTIIAHQLAKLLLEGRRYDVYGNLREWSTSQSLLNYNTKAECISEQYKQFYIPGLGRNVNTSKTQDEDVAQTFGKIIAYKAYKTWAESHEKEPSLPGLKYTPRQLFWIASAMFECTKLMQVAQDDHQSNSRIRVVGPLRNFPSFSKDFNCPGDAFMNPNEKCTLW